MASWCFERAIMNPRLNHVWLISISCMHSRYTVSTECPNISSVNKISVRYRTGQGGFSFCRPVLATSRLTFCLFSPPCFTRPRKGGGGGAGWRFPPQNYITFVRAAIPCTLSYTNLTPYSFYLLLLLQNFIYHPIYLQAPRPPPPVPSNCFNLQLSSY